MRQRSAGALRCSPSCAKETSLKLFDDLHSPGHFLQNDPVFDAEERPSIGLGD
jgi:hypothetical protein